jgi:hypothetical protein
MFNLIGIALVFLIFAAVIALLATPVSFCGALLSAGFVQWKSQRATSHYSLMLCALLGGAVTAAVISVSTVVNPWLVGGAIAFVAGALAVPMKILYHNVTGSQPD